MYYLRSTASSLSLSLYCRLLGQLPQPDAEGAEHTVHGARSGRLAGAHSGQGGRRRRARRGRVVPLPPGCPATGGRRVRVQGAEERQGALER